jgi:signal transduction histidine kinase
MTLSGEQLTRLWTRRRELFESEKARLARKIHDEISQQLTILAFELSLLQPKSKSGKQATFRVSAAKVQEIASLVHGVHQTVREITDDLRPKILDEFGLVAALQWQTRRLEKQGIRCKVITANEDVELPALLSSELFSLFQEWVDQIVRPSKIAEIEVNVEVRGAVLQMEMRTKDKGLKKQLTDSASSVAWLSIEESVARLQGKLRMLNLSRGTAILVTVPIGGEKQRSKSQPTRYASNSHH